VAVSGRVEAGRGEAGRGEGGVFGCGISLYGQFGKSGASLNVPGHAGAGTGQAKLDLHDLHDLHRGGRGTGNPHATYLITFANYTRHQRHRSMVGVQCPVHHRHSTTCGSSECTSMLRPAPPQDVRSVLGRWRSLPGLFANASAYPMTGRRGVSRPAALPPNNRHIQSLAESHIIAHHACTSTSLPQYEVHAYTFYPSMIHSPICYIRHASGMELQCGE
jgi:hypothetical protein